MSGKEIALKVMNPNYAYASAHNPWAKTYNLTSRTLCQFEVCSNSLHEQLTRNRHVFLGISRGRRSQQLGSMLPISLHSSASILIPFFVGQSSLHSSILLRHYLVMAK